MISVILYGRNDAYGAQSQRRAALSINSIAAALTDATDEIVYVDYNSDDDVATFPEAIADTLTSAARMRLQVVRVRREHHRRLAGVDAPPVVESIARNIGLRHTHPAEGWILSTNTDVVIVPAERSLSEIVSKLQPGFYGAPRYELPRFLWQSLDRTDPKLATDEIKRCAPSLHLDENVLHYLPAIGFDSPGDFQLMPRSHLMEIGGFNEAMRHAWHVDSNIMARLALKFGPVRQIEGDLKVYHCEHTSSAAAKHASGRVEDSFEEFVTGIDTSAANCGRSWGGGDIDFQMFNLGARHPLSVVDVLKETIVQPATQPYVALYGPSTYGQVPRQPRHVLPFVIDRIIQLPRDIRIGWLGIDPEMLHLVRTALRKLDFQRELNITDYEDVDFLLIDGPPASGMDAASERSFWADFGTLVAGEMERVERGEVPRHVLALNAVHSSMETALLDFFDVVLSPFTTRLRPGTIKTPNAALLHWLPDLRTGDAGKRTTDGDPLISIEDKASGYVFFGPGQKLLPGDYTIAVEARSLKSWRTMTGRSNAPLTLEVVSGDNFLAQCNVELQGHHPIRWKLDFSVPPSIFFPESPGIEVRLWSPGQVMGEILRVDLGRRRRGIHSVPD